MTANVARILILGTAAWLAAAGCASVPRAAGESYLGKSKPGEGSVLTAAENDWVERTLAALTLRERVAQLIMPWVGGEYAAEGSPEFEQVRKWVETDKVGGLILRSAVRSRTA